MNHILNFILSILFLMIVKKIHSSSKNLTSMDMNKLQEHAVVTDSETFPYMVAILRKFTYISAGALIDDSWVLTGADSLFIHTDNSMKYPELDLRLNKFQFHVNHFQKLKLGIRESSRIIRVRLGSVNYKKGGFLTGIKFFEIHPYFDDSKPLFDVALIKLPVSVRLNPRLNPIKLQNRLRNVIPLHFTVTAWPRSEGTYKTKHQKSMDDINRQRLLTVSHLHPLDREKCADEMEMWISDYTNKNLIMCLEPAINSNPCQRDIGAPVVLNGILWGIISSWKSEDCDVDGEPIFMTLVSSREVSSWIHATVHGHRWTKKHTIDYEDNFI